MSEKKNYRVRNRVRRLAQEAVEKEIIDSKWAVDPAAWGPDMQRHFETLNQIADDLAADRSPGRGRSKHHRHLHRLFGSMLAEVLARRRALKTKAVVPAASSKAERVEPESSRKRTATPSVAPRTQADPATAKPANTAARGSDLVPPGKVANIYCAGYATYQAAQQEFVRGGCAGVEPDITQFDVEYVSHEEFERLEQEYEAASPRLRVVRPEAAAEKELVDDTESPEFIRWQVDAEAAVKADIEPPSTEVYNIPKIPRAELERRAS